MQNNVFMKDCKVHFIEKHLQGKRLQYKTYREKLHIQITNAILESWKQGVGMIEEAFWKGCRGRWSV